MYEAKWQMLWFKRNAFVINSIQGNYGCEREREKNKITRKQCRKIPCLLTHRQPLNC